MPEPPSETAEQALQRIGITPESLSLLAWKALDDALRRHGAFLDRDRKEDAHAFLVEAGCRVAIRYDPQKANGLAPVTVLYRRMRLRYTDWLRMTLGDTRYRGRNQVPRKPLLVPVGPHVIDEWETSDSAEDVYFAGLDGALAHDD